MRHLKTFLLPSAILAGLCIPEASGAAWTVRWLLAGMIFLSFIGPSQVSWRESLSVLMRLTPIWLLLAPSVWVLAIFFWPEARDFAWAAFLVALAPTATAAPAVVRMRGGEPGLVMTGVLTQHLLVAFLVPFWVWAFHAWIPMGVVVSSSGWDLPARILIQVLPLVIVPFALAKVLRRMVPEVANGLAKFHPASLFLWAIAVFLVVARARAEVGELLTRFSGSHGVGLIVSIALASLLLCVVQFVAGRFFSPPHHAEEGAQILGQKNTILAIWIGGTWLGPWASLGPLFYVLWQNLYIAWVSSQTSERPKAH